MRVMTFNAHSCKGSDGLVSHERIAQVIADIDPDIVALQELDVDQDRSHRSDQPQLIANYLKYLFHFSPAFSMEQGSYGNAIFSRYPMQCIQAKSLPGSEIKVKKNRYGIWNPVKEPRGALWVSVQIPGKESVQVITTHLGLTAQERGCQVDTLLSDEWIAAAAKKGPVIFCADMNAIPLSRVYRKMRSKLLDAQHMNGFKRKATFPSCWPVLRIDHIFLSHEWKVLDVQVPSLHRQASDHLPVVVDCELS